jgi:probable phosphoglycerate mutase
MVGSWVDYDLTEFGKEQAKCIGKKLYSKLEEKNTVVFSSDLLRALHTAQPLAGLLGVSVLVRRELRERDLGIAAGKPVQWLLDNMECQEESVDDRMFHDAESRRDVYNRLKPFYRELLLRDEDSAVVVSHCDTLAVFNALCLGLDFDTIDCSYIREHLQGKAGGVTILHREENGLFEMERPNDLSYQEG